MEPPIYLDHNATTPIDPRVAEAMLPFIHEHFGNPSSSHAYGKPAKKAVEKAREQIARMLRAKPSEVIFTSGGTESNNTAIKGAARAWARKGRHIITSAIEHPAVIEVCRSLESEGFRTTYLPVDGDGLVSLRQLEEAITPETILITIMHSNNETGTLQPIGEIAGIARRYGILIHTDAAQSVGKVPVFLDELQVDLLSIAGHKLYAPKGVGALFVRAGVEVEKMMHGAGQEGGFRAGTENVLEIAGLGEACQMIHENLDSYRSQLLAMRDRLEGGLKARFPELRVNGHVEKRLPNTSSVSFKGIEANAILERLEGVAASAGSACHSNRIEVSSVLKAMGVPMEYAMGTIRFSVGRTTTAQEIDRAIEETEQVVSRIMAERQAR